jgi:hypothetical protein
MDALKNITQRIEDGFVVNEHGRWLYMAEQRIYERRVIEQIVNGHVLVDGKWVAIGEAQRLARRGKAAARRQQTQSPSQSPPAPTTPLAPSARVTPLGPPSTETSSFEAVGDMMETICIDMSPMMKPPQTAQAEPNPESTETTETAESDEEIMPSHVDSVLIYGLTTNSAASQSRYAMAYIDELNISRKRSGMFGKLAKLSIALAVAAAAVLTVIHYVD